ncbi:MAG: 5,6-dimethylbenzimidazole synthase [Actinomycetota bacterium]|nr:5,6-dimethylbenzimidazole synthase [Actinomycetota bacterium]
MVAVVQWPRPVPTVGDTTSSAERAADPRAWAFPPPDVDALHRVLAARRDIRRFRPDPIDDAVLRRVLAAAHMAPSVGHSQPWRFVVVEAAAARQRAAVLADEQRIVQAEALDEASGRHLLDLDLEGIREAPAGIVVCCDRRAPASGVLGRATFADADLWSCACAIENLWLAARAEGLGVGWVTLFRPDDLAALVGAPDGVATLGWLCIGWPDERPPAPGLERRGWSRRLPLDDVVLRERWPVGPGPDRPVSRLAGPQLDPQLDPPSQWSVVAARDESDRLLTPAGSLGVLDVVAERIGAVGLVVPAPGAPGGTLVLAAADHPVAALGVSAYRAEVTRHVVQAALAGQALGVVAARQAGLRTVVVDAGVDGSPLGPHVVRPAGPRGDLATTDALTLRDCRDLVAAGRSLGGRLAGDGLVALGEAGVGNTTVAAALAAALLSLPLDRAVGLGAGSDRAIVDAKRAVVAAALARVGAGWPPDGPGPGDGAPTGGASTRGVAADGMSTGGAPQGGAPATLAPMDLLAALGGPEVAFLAGVVLGVADAGGVVVLDGLATSVAALVAVRMEPAVAAHLVAGQRSREIAHGPVLAALGLEPVLDLRIRAGEGAGAALACGLVLAVLRARADVARVAGMPSGPDSSAWIGSTVDAAGAPTGRHCR